MPHAVFNLGTNVTTADLAARQLIPGVEPGMGIHNIFAQQRMKRALLLQDAWTEPNDIGVAAGVTARVNSTVYLKLSQESGLDPGLLLPVTNYMLNRNQSSAVAEYAANPVIKALFNAQGTVWAPAWVGARVVARGTMAAFDVDLHLDYEAVEVPWEQWFIGWDFLDNVVNNERQY